MIKKQVLKNGMTVLVDSVENAKSVSISYFVKTGSYNEKKYPAGISHFIEHMLFKGTKNRTARDINEAIDFVGGVMNAYTDYNITKYYCIMPYDQWRVGADVFSDMIWNHTIPKDELEKERTVILEEIKMYNDDPRSVAYDNLHAEMHKNYPERQSIIGTSDSVKSITREDILAYIEEFYQPDNIVLVVTGNVSEEEVIEFVNNYPVSRKGTTNKIKSNFKPDILNSDTKVINKDIEQAHLSFGLFVPKQNKKDAYTADLISSLFGGSMSSRLVRIIREEKGLAYTVSVSYYDFIDGGYIYGYVGLESGKVQSVKDIIIEEFEKLASEIVSEDELDKIKANNNGQFMLSLEKPSSVNDYVGRQYVSGESIDPESYVSSIKNVSSTDIQDFAKKHFTPDNWQFVEVMPK